MSGGTPRDILGSINYHNQQIFLSVLGQFLMLGQGKSGGSRALSEDASTLFVHSLEYYANYFNKVTQNKVVRDLVDLNWGKDIPAPKVKHEKVGDDNIQMFSDAIQKLFQSGVMTPTLETEKFIRDMLKMPALSTEEEDAWEKPTPAAATATIPAEVQTANEILKSAKVMSERISEIVG